MYKRSNIVKLNKKTICLIITLLSITLIASIVFTNKNNSTKNLDIPNLQIKSNSEMINSCISSYNYNGKTKYLTKYKTRNYSLTVTPSSEINLEFSEIPHEYSIQQINNNNSIDINNYSFKSPEIKGSYTYSVSARWYDTGDIVYKFTINVE